MANHTRSFTDDIERRGPTQGGTLTLPTSSAAAAAAEVGPPLMCDMKLTLERVSEHFYRIGGPVEGPSETQRAVAAQDKEPPPPEGVPPLQQGAPKANVWQQLTRGAAAGNIEAAEQGDVQREEAAAAAAAAAATAAATGTEAPEAGGDTIVDVLPETAAEPAPAAAGIAANAAADAADRAVRREAELCIICYNTVANAVLLFCGHGGLCFACAETCLHRSARCPTCRCLVKGVVVLKERQASQMLQGEQLEGVVRDVAS
ncbi:hypothetical protein, conserved [Eimeria brunetti]|uniref:RING-type domain-containing protein n=1 Tax=Eimeria brunetti TaxID=51314 RepID=U6LA27_9EIME|nr:hypothetical protein, conserved [Eimeria brunetti]